MAIGGGAEIGVVFGRWGDMNEREKDLWCATFRERFGDDLLKGYATLAYPKRYANGSIQYDTDDETQAQVINLFSNNGLDDAS